MNGSTDPIIYKVSYGDEITLPDAPDLEGYEFLYWKGSEYLPGDKYVVTGPHKFTAVYKQNEIPEEEPESSAEPEPSVEPEPEEDNGNTPKTGDNSHTAFWIFLMVAAISCAIGILLTKKRILIYKNWLGN